jgi:hypothetical protein
MVTHIKRLSLEQRALAVTCLPEPQTFSPVRTVYAPAGLLNKYIPVGESNPSLYSLLFSHFPAPFFVLQLLFYGNLIAI